MKLKLNLKINEEEDDVPDFASLKSQMEESREAMGIVF